MEQQQESEEEQQPPPGIRRTLSEEVQTSSKEITEQILKALVAPNIRKTLSEDLATLQSSSQICMLALVSTSLTFSSPAPSG
jgi:hypothetical protein